MKVNIKPIVFPRQKGESLAREWRLHLLYLSHESILYVMLGDARFIV